MKRIALLLLLVATTSQAQRTMTYNTLAEGQSISGFRTVAVYLNDSDRPMGARFVHQRSGFTLDLLEIQSVPQAFVWVTTFPTSDMGEPHTQEHLLLGKGNKGRNVANNETMSLAGSSAFTEQWRTCYDFYTPAGPDVFYGEFERRMDALLHPDYSDEEVHREVRNFGVVEDPGDRTLSLEEKGSVYNEMVTSMDQPGRRIYRAATTMIYGAGHPLQFNSGGSPEALRQLQPADIRKFHAEHYHLANMGAVVSVPKEMSVDSVLQRLDGTLNRVQPNRPRLPVLTERDLPAPKPSPAGEIRLVEYPNRSDQQAGSLWLTWPADRNLGVTEQTLLGLFLQTFAGDPTTNLYKRFIDSKTREFELGAQSVFGSLQSDQGFPVIVGFGDVPVSRMNENDMADVRARVLAEFRRIEALPDGSVELKEFNERLRNRIVQMQRDLSKFVNTPPGFGFRGTGSDWLQHLTDLNKESGFRKSVTMKPVLDAVTKIIAGDSNVWARYIPQWKLSGDAMPWVLAAKPNPDLAAKQQQERSERVEREVARLQSRYGVTENQEAIRRYRADYDTATLEIDNAAAAITPPRFVDNPPLTLDDQLEYQEMKVAGVPLVASTFDSMTSGTTGLALRLDSVPQSSLLYLSMLPQLLTRVGVIENGLPVSYEAMSERLRKEILGLNADFATNSKTGRVELVVRGSGNNVEEARRATEWMQLVLFHADWRPQNLARIRDVVDQVLSSLRRTPQTAEENWVRAVATAFWRQDNPLLLTATSFMTQTHHVQRLRWMLKEATAEARVNAVAALKELSALQAPRADLKARLSTLESSTDKLLADAARDIDITLAEIPDSSLGLDWNRLCMEMAVDLASGPEKALTMLEAVRREVLQAGNARMFQIGSAATRTALGPALQQLVGGLGQNAVLRTAYGRMKSVSARLQERDPSATNPIFAGLLNPNSQGGVFINSAPLLAYEETSADKLLDYLSMQLYGGGGGHSIFMKTWGAGLAYSNGIGASPATGRASYYAERTPELPQTMRFVIDQLKSVKPDPALVEYAIAQAFTGTRAASSYETRGEAMAQNLVDGVTPEVVTRFHRDVLNLRRAGDLVQELYRRMPRVASMVLPGMSGESSKVNDGVYFVIGPEKQFAAWEEYLKSSEGPDATLYRLYPRDFWLP